MKKCVFFDRDGIVNESPGPGYVERWEDFVLQADFVDALRAARAAGYGAAVITNQRGVALGKMTVETLEDMHRRLRDLLEQDHGLTLLDVLYCPHERNACRCRKPQPGMLIEAARRHDIDLAASWMVGDSESDIEAGARAGCTTVLVSPDAVTTRADHHVRTMADLARLLADRLT
jgi:histidinol-phosphate phosphatase family protein